MLAARDTLDSISFTVRVRIQVLRPYGCVWNVVRAPPRQDYPRCTFLNVWTFRIWLRLWSIALLQGKCTLYIKLVDSLLGLQDRTELFPTNSTTFRTEIPSQWYRTRIGQIYKWSCSDRLLLLLNCPCSLFGFCLTFTLRQSYHVSIIVDRSKNLLPLK